MSPAYPFQRPSAKNGVIYAIIKPRPFSITQVTIILLSHARDSVTVLSDFEKLSISSAIAAVTIPAIVEIASIWLYTSFIISSAFCHTVTPAAHVLSGKHAVSVTHKNDRKSNRPTLMCLHLPGISLHILFFT